MIPLIEMCVDSVESALSAQAGGAQRIELCADLLEGGTTPSHGTLVSTRKVLSIGMNVIIRPRGGDFLYSEAEYAVIKQDLLHARECGADGVVIGLLNADGTVDKERTAELVALAHPMTITFHRAFDLTRDPFKALEDLIDLGIDRVLTSGQESSALEGLETLTRLVGQAKDRIIIMPGGGVNARNIQRILTCGAHEVHMHSARALDSGMTYRSSHCYMGSALRPAEYALSITAADDVAQIVAAAK